MISGVNDGTHNVNKQMTVLSGNGGTWTTDTLKVAPVSVQLLHDSEPARDRNQWKQSVKYGDHSRLEAYSRKESQHVWHMLYIHHWL